jgi:hypothetical protein
MRTSRGPRPQNFFTASNGRLAVRGPRLNPNYARARTTELGRDFIRMRTREAIVTEMEIDTRTPRSQGHRRRRYLRLPRPYQPQLTQLQMLGTRVPGRLLARAEPPRRATKRPRWLSRLRTPLSRIRIMFRSRSGWPGTAAQPSSRAGRYWVLRSSRNSLSMIFGRTLNKITGWPRHVATRTSTKNPHTTSMDVTSGTVH